MLTAMIHAYLSTHGHKIAHVLSWTKHSHPLNFPVLKEICSLSRQLSWDWRTSVIITTLTCWGSSCTLHSLVIGHSASENLSKSGPFCHGLFLSISSDLLPRVSQSAIFFSELQFSTSLQHLCRSESLHFARTVKGACKSHCQKFGSKWRTRVRIESLMAAKSCKEMYGISTKIQNTTTKSHNIP